MQNLQVKLITIFFAFNLHFLVFQILKLHQGIKYIFWMIQFQNGKTDKSLNRFLDQWLNNSEGASIRRTFIAKSPPKNQMCTLNQAAPYIIRPLYQIITVIMRLTLQVYNRVRSGYPMGLGSESALRHRDRFGAFQVQSGTLTVRTCLLCAL